MSFAGMDLATVDYGFNRPDCVRNDENRIACLFTLRLGDQAAGAGNELSRLADYSLRHSYG